MSRAELVDAYESGRITRRQFMVGLAAAGGALSIVLAAEAGPAGAQKKSPAKKKAPAKKKPTVPPGLE